MNNAQLADLGWSEEQWNRVVRTVQVEAQKARVAAQFLPVVQVADKAAVAVPDYNLSVSNQAPQAPNPRLVVDSTPDKRFTSFAVNVALTSQEMQDPEQASALVQIRRAANLIARLEDALVFGGQPGPNQPPPHIGGLPPVFAVSGGAQQDGLFKLPPFNDPGFPRHNVPVVPINNEDLGSAIARTVIEAIGELEAGGQNRPFAAVFGQDYFTALHAPSPALILPRDRIAPVIEGPLLRSSTLPPDSGVLVALGGSPIDLVVSSELHVRFLQITTEPTFVFRISERVALRVTDWSSVAVLHPKAKAPKQQP